jgi:hypothetical protein
MKKTFELNYLLMGLLAIGGNVLSRDISGLISSGLSAIFGGFLSRIFNLYSPWFWHQT